LLVHQWLLNWWLVDFLIGESMVGALMGAALRVSGLLSGKLEAYGMLVDGLTTTGGLFPGCWLCCHFSGACLNHRN